MKTKYIFLKLFFILFAVNLFSCRGAIKTDASTATGTPTPTPVSPTAPQPVENSSGFNVKAIVNTELNYILHRGTGIVSDDFSAECKVDPSAVQGSTDSDIMCIAEAKELDLYFNGIAFRYNVPQSMCDYVKVETPYFYNNQPGVGPDIVINNVSNASPSTYLGYTIPANKYLLVYSDAPGYTKVSEAIYCPYDYKNKVNPFVNGQVYPSFGNCCTGTFTSFVMSTDLSSAISSSTQTGQLWNGKNSNCLAGPAMQTAPYEIQKVNKTNGYPQIMYYNVLLSGINNAYRVVPPISMDWSDNTYVANYFSSADHGGGSNVPMAFRSVTSSTAPATQPYYQFTCLDNHEEVKARIRIMVRDWNSAAEYALGALGNPDAGGSETNFGSGPINDYLDFKDIGNLSFASPFSNDTSIAVPDIDSFPHNSFVTPDPSEVPKN